ncbi:hypothetical protein [Stenotrophomonas sp.]|uniref:hypothetical protein n=1 Tax=Stenotrophomonas sp. TaxID=69392 RepID=UPI0028974714|nr:hypothetical protein [Stenotrophomonas sp.]
MKGWKRPAVVLGALLGLPLLVWAVSRALPVPAAQAQALEGMRQASRIHLPAQGNAFTAIWLLPYDGVPVDQWEALLAEDVARHDAARSRPGDHGVATSVAAERFPTIDSTIRWCRRDAGSCLAEVREHQAAVAAHHAGHEGLHERMAALTAYTHYRSAFTLEPTMPFPQFGLLLERTSAHALAHVRGDSLAALQGVCEDATTARMLMRNSDTLIMAAIGGAWAERSASLFTDILAELPRETALPALCATAFAPPQVAELDMCQPLRGEFAFQAAAMTAANLEPYQRPFFSEEKTQARAAWLLSRSCSASVQAQLRMDERVQLPAPPPVWDPHCVANLAGCILMGIDAPDYVVYLHRMQDNGAQLRLAANMMWLREQPLTAGDDNAMIALMGLPEELRSASRGLRDTPAGDALELERYDARDGQHGRLRAALPLHWRARFTRPLCARPV